MCISIYIHAYLSIYLAFFGDEEISAFDVAVKDLLLVEVVQSIQELLTAGTYIGTCHVNNNTHI
jgi:hypothetical protein